MSTPEQHAATVRDLDERLSIALTWVPTPHHRPAREALDELVALAGRADCGGVNCGKCQQCLTVHEFFLREALEAAAARADELQRELRDAIDTPATALWETKEALEQARREADQLRAALEVALREALDRNSAAQRAIDTWLWEQRRLLHSALPGDKDIKLETLTIRSLAGDGGGADG